MARKTSYTTQGAKREEKRREEERKMEELRQRRAAEDRETGIRQDEMRGGDPRRLADAREQARLEAQGFARHVEDSRLQGRASVRTAQRRTARTKARQTRR